MTEENILTYYARAALSRWRAVLALVIGCTLVAWGYSVFVLADDPEYEASARLNVVPTSEELGYANQYARGQTSEGGLILLQTYAEYVHSRDTLETVADAWVARRAKAAGVSSERWLSENITDDGFSVGGLISLLNYGNARPLPPREKIITELNEGTLIENVDGTYLMQLTVTWDDPRDAAWLANALAKTVIARAQGLSRQSGEQLSDVLVTELDRKKAELAERKKASRERKIALGIVDLDQQKQALLTEQIAEQSRLTSDRAAAQQARGQVAGLQRESSPKLSQTQQTVADELALQRPRANALEQSIAIRERRLGAIEAELATLAANELPLKNLDDEIAALTAEVERLTERAQFSETENLANIPRIRLVDAARVPTQRSAPKVLINTALGFIAGSALAFMWVILLGPRVVAVKTPEEPEDDTPVEEPLVWRRSPDPDPDPSDNAQPLHIARGGKETLHANNDRHPREGGGPASFTIRDKSGTPAFAGRTINDQWEPVQASGQALAVAQSEQELHFTLPGFIDRPALDNHYSASEIDRFASRISGWLEPALASGRPLCVVSADDSGDANLLADLIRRGLAQQGAVMPEIRLLGPLVEHANFAALLTADAPVVLALRRSFMAEADLLTDNIATLTGQPPYVAYFQD